MARAGDARREITALLCYYRTVVAADDAATAAATGARVCVDIDDTRSSILESSSTVS